MRKFLIGAVVAGLAVVGLPTVAAAHHAPRHRAGHHHPRHHSDETGSSSTTTTTTTDSSSTSTSGSGGAGTVASYADGVLTVTLADGSTVSGKVGRFTHVRCTDADVSGDEGHGASGHDAGDGWGYGRHHADCTLSAGESLAAADLALLPGGAVWREVIVELSSTTSSTTTTSTDTSTTTSTDTSTTTTTSSAGSYADPLRHGHH